MLLDVFLNICLPILVLAGIGWGLDRLFQLDLKTLVKLNINLVVPAFIFVKVVQSPLGGGVALQVVAFTLSVMAGLFLIAEVYGRIVRMPTPARRSLQMAGMFYNSGNYGLPLMALAYPGVGPAIQVFVLLTLNISTFSLGLILASSGQGAAGWRRWWPVLRQWTLWAVCLGLLVRYFGLPVEQVTWFWQPLRYLSDALIGVALITLGVQLSKTDHTGLFQRVRAGLVLRLVVGPCLAFGLAHLYGFEGEVAAVLILGAGVPTAVNIALLAHEFKADYPFLAGAVFYSTLLSAATVTLLATLLQYLAP